ncbi:MAG: ORF6N domain-containing protein [Candidatus Omnitrophica bacterium]|nr:ORF6N domain-containing protein [Candidatus Omnitrophota bacterium]
MSKIVTVEKIESRIFQIRGKKVILDRDLARLYGVEAKYLKRQVRRNNDRFPPDFMFKLSKQEFKNWRSQFVTSNSSDKMGLRYPPYVFTEQGVAMLSSVLNSKRAIMVNVQIMRAFVNLRRIALTYVGLRRKIEAMEKKYDTQFKIVFKAIKKLLEPQQVTKKRRIGFRVD